MRKPSAIREKITYPRVTISSDFNPCYKPSSTFEHALSCGHLITTPTPDEQCAPNCYHMIHEKSTMTRRKMIKNTALKNDFYCDACVEEEAEMDMPARLSRKAAEKHRLHHRKESAADQDKANRFRKCYIAQKIISVPCDEDGDVLGTYDPHPNAHPFDTATPPTGNNMFEDVQVLPVERPKSKKRRTRPSVTRSESAEASSAAEVDAEEVDETVTEGTRWLQEQTELQHRRAEARTRTRGAAAHPIVIGSSPEPELSGFVFHSSSPRTTQSSPQGKRGGKRKTATQDAAPSPTAQRAKRANPTPNLVAQKGNSYSRATMAKRPSRRGCGIL